LTIDIPTDPEFATKDYIQFIDPANTTLDQLDASHNAAFGATAAGISLHAQHKQLEIRLLLPDARTHSAGGSQPALITGFPITPTGNPYPRINTPIRQGPWQKGQSAGLGLTIKAGGDIDHGTAHLSVNTEIPGRIFDGIGGNFRIQNAKLDPPVIDYC